MLDLNHKKKDRVGTPLGRRLEDTPLRCLERLGGGNTKRIPNQRLVFCDPKEVIGQVGAPGKRGKCKAWECCVGKGKKTRRLSNGKY